MKLIKLLNILYIGINIPVVTYGTVFSYKGVNIALGTILFSYLTSVIIIYINGKFFIRNIKYITLIWIISSIIMYLIKDLLVYTTEPHSTYAVGVACVLMVIITRELIFNRLIIK